MDRARLYTEHSENLADIASLHFESFSIFRGVGYWQGKREECAVIEVLDVHHDTREFRNTCENCASEIKQANGQDSILLTFDAVQGELW